MKVICIQDVYWIKNPEVKSLHRGSIYHVTGLYDKKDLEMEYELAKHIVDGAWYELLEVNGFHHSSHFLEIPSDNIVIEEQSKLETNKN